MEENNKYLIPVAIVIAGALIALGLMANPKEVNHNEPTEEETGVAEEITMKSFSSEDHFLGDPNAELLLLEYSDLECPYCQRFYKTTKQIIDEYGKEGKLVVAFRHFPLDGHQNARPAAIASECATKLGGNTAFWDFVDSLMEKGILNKETYMLKAEEIGLYSKEFETCLLDQDGEINKTIDEMYQDGIAAGVLGTPADPGGTPYSLLITKDGEITQIKGAQSYQTVKAIIENALSK